MTYFIFSSRTEENFKFLTSSSGQTVVDFQKSMINRGQTHRRGTEAHYQNVEQIAHGINNTV